MSVPITLGTILGEFVPIISYLNIILFTMGIEKLLEKFII